MGKFKEVIHKNCKGSFKLVTKNNEEDLRLVCTQCFGSNKLNLLINKEVMRRVTSKDNIEIIQNEKI